MSIFSRWCAAVSPSLRNKSDLPVAFCDLIPAREGLKRSGKCLPQNGVLPHLKILQNLKFYSWMQMRTFTAIASGDGSIQTTGIAVTKNLPVVWRFGAYVVHGEKNSEYLQSSETFSPVSLPDVQMEVNSVFG